MRNQNNKIKSFRTRDFDVTDGMDLLGEVKHRIR
jgi:hypothetical protein